MRPRRPIHRAGGWSLVLLLPGLLLLLPGGATPAAAHHVGAYTPRDNEVSANFKQLKFAMEAGKLDVALRLFETGAVRREMRAQAARLPAGLEASVAASLRAQDRAEAERGLVVFFAATGRDLALEALRQVTDASVPVEVRAAAGQRFLEAIWRYYNLVDFAVSRHDPRAAVAVRLAFDEAESYVKGTAAPAAVNPCAGPKPVARGTEPPRPERLRDPLRRIAEALAGIVETSSPNRRPS
jgi:hypothetical protein